jgi:hypothetical protein
VGSGAKVFFWGGGVTAQHAILDRHTIKNVRNRSNASVKNVSGQGFEEASETSEANRISRALCREVGHGK